MAVDALIVDIVSIGVSQDVSKPSSLLHRCSCLCGEKSPFLELAEFLRIRGRDVNGACFEEKLSDIDACFECSLELTLDDRTLFSVREIGSLG